MQRLNPLTLIVCLLMLSSASFLRAQNASGNVAESGPYAHWELYDAQNPPARTFEGCVSKVHSDLWLIPRHGEPWLVNSATSDALRGLTGAHVKVRARENFGAARRDGTRHVTFDLNREAGYGLIEREVMIDREINVDRVRVISSSCPADWISK